MSTCILSCSVLIKLTYLPTQDPVCDAFREIVHNALDTADRETQKIYLAHRLTGAQLFAVAAYQVIYDPDHLHYLQGKRAMDSGLLGSMDEMDIYVDVQPRCVLFSFVWKVAATGN